MEAMRSGRTWLAVIVVLAGVSGARAVDKLVLGKKLLVKDPTGSEQSRTVVVIGKEAPSDLSFDNTVPTSANLRVILSGSSPSDVTYPLGAPGTWEQQLDGSLKYTGGDPAKLILVKFKPATTPSFLLKAKLKGSGGAQSLDSIPPNTGTEGVAILTLVRPFGTERYCVAFGGPAGGTPTADDGSMWKVLNATGQTGCFPPDSAQGSVGAGATVTTDSDANGATPSDPVETFVATPNAGTVDIAEGSITDADPPAFTLVGQQVQITAPDATESDPLVLVFLVDSSVVPPPQDASSLQVFRDGEQVDACVGGPGPAFPDPCVSERTMVGDDVRITVLSSHASFWTFAFPACGNGIVNDGIVGPLETCDPPFSGDDCGADECKSDCQCAPACDCCSSNPGTFELTTSIGSGNCGTMTLTDGTDGPNLVCNHMYVGGGMNMNNPSHIWFPDDVQLQLKLAVSRCDPVLEELTLVGAPPEVTGSAKTCTTAGCRFGPPVPIPDYANPPNSACVVLSFAENATGRATCDAAAQVRLPLDVDVFVSGDNGMEPSVQPCPRCIGGTCTGGPNGGRPCVPNGTLDDLLHPTSQDCPPNPADHSATIRLYASVATNATSRVRPISDLGEFCKFCRDSLGNFQMPPRPCGSYEECTSLQFPKCEQGSPGAFGAAVNAFRLTGSQPGCLAVGGAHPATLVGATCVRPTFSPIDVSSALPGPAALSLRGDVQLGLGPATTTTATSSTSTTSTIVCDPNGTACVSAMPCCSNNCANGMCCSAYHGEICTVSADCCDPGGTCISGRCELPTSTTSTTSTTVCAPNGNACGNGMQCCSGNCPYGVCCSANYGEVCAVSADCCDAGVPCISGRCVLP